MEVAIVLGNRMNDDGSLSEIMKTRLALTLRLIAEHSPDKIILSGGPANPKANVTEAEAMERFLVDNGVDKSILIKEERSLTTKQNAKFSVPLAVAFKPEKIWLCSSREHVERKYLNPVNIFNRKLKKDKIFLEVYTNN